MITLINYADANMTISQQKNKESALRHGVQQVICYNESHIAYDFYRMNKDILDAERGAGYWLWKPWIIYTTMLDLADGEILIYSDVGIEFIDNVRHIVDRMKDDFFFFSNGWKHEHWCKSNVAAFINPGMIDFDNDGTPHYKSYGEYNESQIQASLLFFRVNNRTKGFVKQWLLYSQMPGFIDDSPSTLKPFPGFQESRHDQMTLTCMAIEKGIYYNNLWCDKIWSNQRHRWPHSDYPPIVLHHRKRDPGKGGGQPEW